MKQIRIKDSRMAEINLISQLLSLLKDFDKFET